MYSIDQQLNEEKNKPVEIDIHPVSKWKRLLVYLGDMMFTFIAAFVVFNIISYPIATVVAPYDSKKSLDAAEQRDSVLYENKILFYEETEKIDKSFNKSLKYTFNRFLAYFTFDDDNIYDVSHPEFTHIKENNVIGTYFKDIKNDVTTYNKIFESMPEYFKKNEEDFTLVDAVKENTKYFFDENERLQSKDYNTLSGIFNSIYGDIIKDIKEHDLTYVDVSSKVVSYNECQKIIDDNSQIFYNRMSISVFISHFISVLILFFIYPLINRFGRTPMHSILKLDRVNTASFKRLKTGEKILLGVYSIFTTLPYIIFLPLSYTTLIYIIDIPFILTFALVAIVFLIINLIVLLVSAFSQTLVDKATRTVIVPNEEYEQIEQIKTM